MTSWPLFKHDVISGFRFVVTAKMSVISNFIVLSLFLKELSSNLVQEDKIKKEKSASKLYSSKPNFLYYFLQTRKIRLRFWSVFSQTPVKNRVTMRTA